MIKLTSIFLWLICVITSGLVYSNPAPEMDNQAFWKAVGEYDHASPSQKASLDKQIWATYGVTKAVVVIDTSGFSLRALDKGILNTLVVINDLRNIVSSIMEKAPGGQIIKFDADNAFLAFDTPDEALETLKKIYVSFANSPTNQDKKYKIQLSSGVTYGPILMLQHDAFSEILNIASKLGEDTAEANEMLFAESAFKMLKQPVKAEKKTVDVSHVNITYYKIL